MTAGRECGEKIEMQSRHYCLNKNLDANKLLHDIKSMIETQSKLNNLNDAILSITIKNISHVQDQDQLRISNDQEDAVRE